MIKKTVTYEDYNEKEITEDFYFNLTKIELFELDLEVEGGLDGTMRQLMETEDAKKAYGLFKKILLAAYGRKTDDGKRFEKSEELTKDFEQSPAMGELIITFLQNPEEAAEFFESVLPAKMVAAAKAAQARETEAPTEKADVELAVAPPVLEPKKEELKKEEPKNEDKPANPRKKFVEFKREELLAMSQEEFDELAGTDPVKMNKEQLIVAMQRKSRG